MRGGKERESEGITLHTTQLLNDESVRERERKKERKRNKEDQRRRVLCCFVLVFCCYFICL